MKNSILLLAIFGILNVGNWNFEAKMEHVRYINVQRFMSKVY
jgi:hypothetical protein